MTQLIIINSKATKKETFHVFLVKKGCTLTNILLILKFVCFRQIKALQQLRVGKWFKIFLATMNLPDLLHISFNPQNSVAGITASLTDKPHPQASDPCQLLNESNPDHRI